MTKSHLPLNKSKGSKVVLQVCLPYRADTGDFLRREEQWGTASLTGVEGAQEGVIEKEGTEESACVSISSDTRSLLPLQSVTARFSRWERP